MFSVIFLGFLIGMQHAMEADHVAAVASLATRSRSIGSTARQGAAWGAGHALTLFLFWHLADDAFSHALLAGGGLLFGAFFMATDPVTSPVTESGKWAYGILIGTTAVLIRSFSGYVEGVMFSILFGNICAPLIDEAVIRFKIRKYALER